MTRRHHHQQPVVSSGWYKHNRVITYNRDRASLVTSDQAMTQCCSLLVLCCGGVAALSAIAAVAIATTTDHWTHVAVDRHAVAEHVPQPGPEQRFYSRHLGLFRVCFPDQEARPALGSPGLYLNSVEVWCYGRDYRLEELLRGVLRPANTSYYGEARLQLARAAPCLLVLYLLLMAVTGLLGLVGCWAQAASKLITTAALQLLAALLGACAMAAWHAALFLEMEKVSKQFVINGVVLNCL